MDVHQRQEFLHVVMRIYGYIITIQAKVVFEEISNRTLRAICKAHFFHIVINDLMNAQWVRSGAGVV